MPVLHNDRLFVHSWMASPSTLGVRDIKTLFDEALGEIKELVVVHKIMQHIRNDQQRGLEQLRISRVQPV